jgi:hypothetical protein
VAPPCTNPIRSTGDRDARTVTARRILALHRMSAETGRCAACRRPCPCDDANAAANTLATGGHQVVEAGGSTNRAGVLVTCLSWLRGR